jgi:hypothetical protein
MILTTIEPPEAAPLPLKQRLALLTGEVWDLHHARRLFWDLWVDSPRSADLIHGVAPGFFTRIRSVLFEHLISGIARLTDPLTTRGNENLTLESLFDPPLPAQFSALYAEAKDIRIIRSKIVAHLDSTAGLDLSKLPTITCEKIRVCIDLAVEIIKLARKRWGAEIYMDPLAPEALEITNCLKRAEAYRQLERAGFFMKDFWNAPEEMKRDFLARPS